MYYYWAVGQGYKRKEEILQEQLKLVCSSVCMCMWVCVYMFVHILSISQTNNRRFRATLLTSFWEFLKQIRFLIILFLFIGCPLTRGYSTNSFLSVIIASTQLLLTTWLNYWESISQPANFAHLLMRPFSVFPLYTHTRLVKGLFLMLHQQSGTLSLTKSGHPTPSHPSNHHLKLIFKHHLILQIIT